MADLYAGEEMIPKTINFVWLGGKLPYQYQDNLDSFRTLNPHHEIIIWGDDSFQALGMDGVCLKRVFPTPAGASNAIRLKILHEMGGMYFDVDFLCRLPVENLLPDGATAVAALQDTRICNAFMAAVPGHPWIKWQLDHMSKYEGHAPQWGPYLATEAPREGLTIIPTHLVYPYLWDSPAHLREPRPDTVAEHLWEGSWLK